MTVPPLDLSDAPPPWLTLGAPVAYVAFAALYARWTRRSKALQRFNQWWAL